jgi:hypothetical protein
MLVTSFYAYIVNYVTYSIRDCTSSAMANCSRR